MRLQLPFRPQGHQGLPPAATAVLRTVPRAQTGTVMSSSELLSLPDECLANIFSFVQQPLFLSLTCRRVYAITQNLSARANWLETQFCSTRFRLHMWLELAARPSLCTPGFLQLLTESRKHVPHAELAQLVLRYDPACSISADFSFLPNVRCLYKISKGRAAVAAHALEIARKSCREPEHPSFKTFTDAFRTEQLSETRPSALADSVGHREFHGHLSSTCEHLNGPLFGLPVSSSLLCFLEVRLMTGHIPVSGCSYGPHKRCYRQFPLYRDRGLLRQLDAAPG